MKEKIYLSPAFKGCREGESPLDKSLNFFLFNGSGLLADLKRKFGNKIAVITHIHCNEKTGVVESIIVNAKSDDLAINKTLTYRLHGIFGQTLMGMYDNEEDEVWPKIKDIIGTRTFKKYFPNHPISFDNLCMGTFHTSEDEDGSVSVETILGGNIFTITKDENGHAVFKFKENDDFDFSVVECQLLDAITLLERHTYFPRTKSDK